MTHPTDATKPFGYFRTDPDGNIRPVDVDDGIKQLCESLALHGYLQPVGAIDLGSHGSPIFGHRRLFAHGYGLSQGMAMPELIPVRLWPPTTTPSAVRNIQVIENIQRQDLTDVQLYLACKSLLESNADWKLKDLATAISKDGGMVTRYLCPDRLDPIPFQAFMDGKISVGTAYKIVSSKTTDQVATMEALTGAPKRGQKKKGTGDTEKVKSMLIAMPAKRRVILKGGFDLSTAREMLTAAIKLVDKALNDGLSARNAQGLWADTSKKPKAARKPRKEVAQ